MKYEKEILKVSIYEPDFKVYEKVRKEIAENDSLSVVISDINYLDVNEKGIDKASGVKNLAKYLDIELLDVICIGDNENDIEMIQEAGLGIAMENACDELLQVCDYVTTSNDNYGVAKAINKYIIK